MKPDLHNINAHIKFGENPLIFTQVIIWKRNKQTPIQTLTSEYTWHMYRPTYNWWTDRHMDIQGETTIPRHYHVAVYKKGQYSCTNLADDYQYPTWPVFYNDINFYKLWIKSMHGPFKSYWADAANNADGYMIPVCLLCYAGNTIILSYVWYCICPITAVPIWLWIKMALTAFT